MSSVFQARCGKCLTILSDESAHIDSSQRKPCPQCGSLSRANLADLTASPNSKGSIAGVTHQGGKSKEKGRVLEFFDGWELRRAVGDLCVSSAAWTRKLTATRNTSKRKTEKYYITAVNP